jgi:hypothetical protein
MFNLADYETVEERLVKFWKEYPDGRIDTHIIEASPNRFIVKASIFRTEADAHAWTTGYAEETVSARGVNATSALENCETSAIGRALANANYATKGKRPSREEMSKVAAQSNSEQSSKRPFAEKLAEKITMAAEDDPWTVKAVEPAAHASMSVDDVAKAIGATVLSDDPTCKHGNRVWATGTSKTGKVWGHWKCDASPMNGQRWADLDKCDPIWCDLSPKGTWTIRAEK